MLVKAKDLKRGDKIVASDNRKWTVDQVRHILGGKLQLLCHNGQSNRRFVLKLEDQVKVEREE